MGGGYGNDQGNTWGCEYVQLIQTVCGEEAWVAGRARANVTEPWAQEVVEGQPSRTCKAVTHCGIYSELRSYRKLLNSTMNTI